MTRIEHFRKTGIRRLGAKERGFRYRRASGARVSAADRERILQLKIPPAWSDVWINSAPGGSIQAIGQDAAGRLQYLYHSDHVRRQEARKLREMKALP